MMRIILNLSLWIPFLTILAGFVLTGLKKTVASSVARLVSFVLAVIVSALITPLVRNGLSPLLWSILESIVKSIASPEATELFATLSGGAEALRVLLGLLAAPSLFMTLFLLAYAIFRLIGSISLRIAKQSSKQNDYSIPGIVLGAVQGIMIAIVIMVPLCGYMTITANVVHAFAETNALDTLSVENVEDTKIGNIGTQSLSQYADYASDCFFLRAMHATGGRLLFEPLTTGVCRTENGDFTVSLEAELSNLAGGIGSALSLSDQLSEKEQAGRLSDEDTRLLYRTKEKMMSSELVVLISTDIVSGMGQNWSLDTPFLGIRRPEVTPVLEPTMGAVYSLLSSETPNTLEQDVDTCIDIYCMLRNSDLLRDDLLSSDLMALLGGDVENGSLLRRIQDALRENPHLAPLAKEIDSLSMRAVAKVLEENGLADGKYDTELDQISDTLNEVRRMEKEARSEVIREQVKEALRAQDIDVPDDVAVAMCEKILADMDEQNIIIENGEQLRDYLLTNAVSLAADVPPDLIDGIPDNGQ